MKLKFLALFAFLPIWLSSLSFLNDDTRISDLCVDRQPTDNFDVSDLTLTLSGEILFLTPTFSLVPKKGPYSPGYRLTMQTSPLSTSLELGGAYSFWQQEKLKTYLIAIPSRTRKIHSLSRFDNAQIWVGQKFFPFNEFSVKPYLGLEWEKYERTILIDQSLKLVNSRTSLGPMVGLKMRNNFAHYFSLSSNFSFAYRSPAYHSLSNNVEKSAIVSPFSPKGSIKIGAEKFFLLGSTVLRLEGGYEMQLFWSKNIQNELLINSPLNLQGFSFQMSLDF